MDPSQSLSFAQATRVEQGMEGALSWKVPQGWMQGRTAYGGIVVGAAWSGIQQVITKQRPLRSLQATFIAPVREGTACLIEVEMLRSGRSLTFYEAKVFQAGQLCTVVHACLGEQHQHFITLSPQKRKDVPSPETPNLIELPFIQGITPDFTQHVQFLFTKEHLPFSGSSEATLQGWCRFRRGEHFNETQLIGLLDAWPSPVLNLVDHPIPASSVTWQIHFCGQIDGHTHEDWWLYESHTDFARDGYADTSAKLYRQDGQLIAYSRQMVVAFLK